MRFGLDLSATCCGCGKERDISPRGSTTVRDTEGHDRVVRVETTCPGCGDDRVRLRMKVHKTT